MSSESKLTDLIKKITSRDATIRRIAFYFFLICVLLVLLLIKLFQINSNLSLIAEQEQPLIEVNTKYDEHNSVLDVFTEEPEQLGDFLPQYNELTEENIENSNNNIEEELKENEPDENTSSADSSEKTTFVININSKKIHYFDCSFVNRMNEENKKVIKLSKIELNDYINNGYTMCSTCGGK